MFQIKSWLNITSVLVVFLFILKPVEKPRLTKALYGLALESAKLKNKTPEQIGRYLKGSGVNAVVRVPFERSIIEALHKHGVKAYAEMTIFSGKEYWDTYPQSRPVLADGNLIEMDEWYAGVCPTQEWLIEQKVKEAETIAKEYQIDGLWLDFIRWPTRWESNEPNLLNTCFCRNCLERFQNETGISIPEGLKTTGVISGWIYKECANSWHDWRCDVIADTVKKIRGAVKKHRPDAIIGIFIVPWRSRDYNNAIYKVMGQDVTKLSKTVDVFSPMSYHLLCHRDTDWIISVTQEIKSKTNKDVWTVIQAIDEPKEITAQEYEKALRAGFAGGSTGVIAFTAEAALKDEKWEALKQVFQGSE